MVVPIMPVPTERRRSFFDKSFTSLKKFAQNVHFFVTRANIYRHRSLRRYSQNFFNSFSRQLKWKKRALARHSTELLIKCEEESVNEAELKELACTLLVEFVSTFIDEDTLDVKRLGGAMTNKVYRCSSPGHETVLLRLYGKGTELLFERERELATFKKFSELGFGPKLLGTFRGGRLEEYIECTTLSPQDLRDPTTSKEIASVMAQLHKLIPTENAQTELWTQLNSWLEQAKASAILLPSNSHAQLPSDWSVLAMIHDVASEIQVLHAHLSSVNSPVVFGHNDAQYGNIIRRKSDGRIMLIDYEYSRFNNRGFDLGNHFCEWAADYGVEDAHRLYFDRYPSEEEQMRFLRAYLESVHPTFNLLSVTGQAHELRSLYVEANKFSLASHLLWCLWGVIQAAHSTIDFNFLEYSYQRLAEYKRRRDVVFQLTV